jgi:hypothetical protein
MPYNIICIIVSVILLISVGCLQEEPDEHGQGKWEGKQEGKVILLISHNKI